MSDIGNGTRILAGAILDLVPVPAGPTREALLDVANPARFAIRELIRKAPEGERPGLRKVFKAVDCTYVTDDQVSELARRALDVTDVHTVTSDDDATRTRLEALVYGPQEPEFPVKPYDYDTEVIRTDSVPAAGVVPVLTAYSEDELRAALAVVESRPETVTAESNPEAKP